MSVLVIDTISNVDNYQQTVQLESLEYVFNFYWLPRDNAWYLDISDQNGNMIAPFIKIVVNWPLTHRFKDPRMFPGVLLAVDRSGAGEELQTQEELGHRIQLMYTTSDDELLSTT